MEPDRRKVKQKGRKMGKCGIIKGKPMRKC